MKNRQDLAMSEQSVLRSPHVVATKLDISPATLRRWSDEFKEFLSDEASGNAERSHRRYQNGDLETLFAVKDLMNEGLTYEQVREKLVNRPSISVELDDISSTVDPAPDVNPEGGSFLEDGDVREAALVAANGDESPAIAFLNNTLATLSDSQKSILNSQAANRELLGVLLQDNFNLKEENNRLRDRILEVEREVSQVRQDEEWRREALRQEIDSKIAASSQLATQAMNIASSIEVPEIKTVESNPGCLGRLLGIAPTRQVVTKSNRPKTGVSPKSGPQTAVGGPPQSAPNHPKPMFPPE
jgi:DNA-binding transcriptional MerR regulator